MSGNRHEPAEALVTTGVSSSMRIDDIYVNVWTSAPSVEQLVAVVEGERKMPPGYRSLEIVERLDRLRFETGVRAGFQQHAEEFAGRPAKNIVLIRAGGFAGTVIHGVVGLLNAVGLQTHVHTDLDSALVELLHGKTSSTIQSAAQLRQSVDAHVAAHVARVPRTV